MTDWDIPDWGMARGNPIDWSTWKSAITFWREGEDSVLGLAEPAPEDYRVKWIEHVDGEEFPRETIVRKGEREITRTKGAFHGTRFDNLTVTTTGPA